MPAYANKSGDSPIIGYELEADDDGRVVALEVTFRHRKRRRLTTYRYEGAIAAALAPLAIAGSGLAAHIARERPRYVARWVD